MPQLPSPQPFAATLPMAPNRDSGRRAGSIQYPFAWRHRNAHGYTLSQAAEDRITDALPALAIHIPEGPYLWNALREVLLGPHAAQALRTMHALGILEMLIPEFHGIDALVIRDSYHRYTVDEHTFLAIDNVHGLRQPAHDYEQRLAQLMPEIDRMDLFLLALLLQIGRAHV